MAKIRHAGPDSLRILVLFAVSLLTATGASSAPELQDAPVAWYADDMNPIPQPGYEEPGLVPFGSQAFLAGPISRFFNPGRLVRRIDDGYPGRVAGDINSLGEVLNSSWFENRIGLYPMDPAEVAEGPGQVDGPDRSSPWEIIGAKVGGVTPGFRIKDGAGDIWLLKFDPPKYPGMSTRSGVVSNLLFHAMGFNTPVDRLVLFTTDELKVRDGVTMRLPRAGEVKLTAANLDSVLQAGHCDEGEHYVALASKFIRGKVLGPYKSKSLRGDDPNDKVRHENRRTVRAMKVFGSWLNHFDTKMHNSLDVYEGAPGEGFVRHYLIDFASTLGSFGAEPVKRFGYEFGIDVPSITGRLFSLGLIEDDWVGLERPTGLDQVGYLDVETFDPEGWEPDIPHSAMAELTRQDGYWAAKVLSAFKEEHIRAAVEQGRYADPRAVDFLVETLQGRQAKIVNHWFDEIPPLDFFRHEGGRLEFMDLAVERGFASGEGVRYRHRLAAVAANREAGPWTDWVQTSRTSIDLDQGPRTDVQHPFLAVRCQVNRGEGWSDTITAYVAPASGRVVAVDR